jgi:plastocyanin
MSEKCEFIVGELEMSFLSWRTRAALLLTVLFAVLGTSTALAHEGRDVGDYNFVVGFINEPAVEGMLNGVSLRVTSLIVEDEHDHDAAMDMGMDMGDGMAMDSEIDLVSHGGVFVDELAAGAHYEFTFDHDYEDLTVPFHAHPIETQGSIMVGHDNPAADEVVVEIHENGFQPVMLMIQAGTTVKFENHMSEPTVVMSGPLGEVETTQDDGHAADNAVAGLTTLQVEVTHVASSVSKVMELKEAWNSPGHYKSEFIPTSPGPYNFRFFGEIEGQTVDESFESSNTTFDEVTPATEIQFPVQLAAPRETENAARGALDAAATAGTDATAAADSASTANTLGIVALVLGLLGLALGGLAFQRSGKKA